MQSGSPFGEGCDIDIAFIPALYDLIGTQEKQTWRRRGIKFHRLVLGSI